MAHEHVVLDSDAIFSIEPKSRVIKNESGKECVVQFDHNSERFTFILPRVIEGHDMSLCNYAEVNFSNKADGTGKQIYGSYIIDDLQIYSEDEDKVMCTWLIPSEATQQVGALDFGLRFICADEDLLAGYKWSTAIYTGIKVLKGMPDTLEESIAEKVNLDFIEQAIDECGVIDYDSSF